MLTGEVKRLSKAELLDGGRRLVTQWCALNGVPEPVTTVSDAPTRFGACAYYRDDTIFIHPPSCAGIGLAGRQWSFPGYVVDRTPYGVMAHELAHHVDRAHGARGGLYGSQWRHYTGEPPITTYCPNDNEWFAEIFRLFLTNPDLLGKVRPRVFGLLQARWPQPVEARQWEAVLTGAERQIQAAQGKIKEARKWASKQPQGDLFA